MREQVRENCLEILFIFIILKFQEELKFNGGRKFDLGFEIDPEFKDQNVLSPNILESRLDDGPVRYGVFKTEENVEQQNVKKMY